jgi:hypothetical protein
MDEVQREFIKTLKIGTQVIMGTDVYQIKSMLDGAIELRKLGGRKTIHMLPDEIPYFDNGELITPTQYNWRKTTIETRINLSRLLKSNTELQVSKPFMALAMENIESLIVRCLLDAEELALSRRQKRLDPGHWPWLEYPMHRRLHYVKSNNEYAKEVSIKTYAKEKKK